MDTEKMKVALCTLKLKCSCWVEFGGILDLLCVWGGVISLLITPSFCPLCVNNSWSNLDSKKSNFSLQNSSAKAGEPFPPHYSFFPMFISKASLTPQLLLCRKCMSTYVCVLKMFSAEELNGANLLTINHSTIQEVKEQKHRSEEWGFKKSLLPGTLTQL